MSINPDTGMITGNPDGTGGTVVVRVALTKEHRLVHDKDNIMWGNEYVSSKTYETVGPVTQTFVVDGVDKRYQREEPISSARGPGDRPLP
jgi:hypothetical protein